MTNDTALCAVCDKPPTDDNRLKGGAHIRYCYAWRRRNDPTRPECVTPACGNRADKGDTDMCNRCNQRRTRSARGATQSQRGLYESNKGRTCTTSWCDKPANTRGQCVACCSWARDGRDPEQRQYSYARTEADIMALVISIKPDPVTGCRDGSSVFSPNEDGYCSTSVDGRVRSVTRLVVSHNLGRPIGANAHACHRCDNPPCVEPTHLWEGTPAENYADRNAKGRTAKGEATGRSRLTEDDVRKIRVSYTPGTVQNPPNRLELARTFGVTPQTIDSIINRRTWKHVL
jgi:hypothetical protein